MHNYSNYTRKKENEKEQMQQILDIFSNKTEKSESALDGEELRSSESLSFLKDESASVGEIFDNPNWNLNSNGIPIAPLKFSNNKTQEDVVKEIITLVKSGVKVVFLHGVCGSGKSAIALNIARALGKASVIVPVKALQKQYEEDYTSKKYLIKKNGQKMKIAMLTGRENHDSIYFPGISSADPNLPENLKITEKNYQKMIQFYNLNPLIQNKATPSWRQMRRISIAPANPYWSPILPADRDFAQIKDAKKKKYMGCDGREYVFYYRKPGCSYYDQHLAYLDSDVIIFNAAKYKSELSLGRKPMTEIDIIDEADEFLDSLYQQEDINLTRLQAALNALQTNTDKGEEAKQKIINLTELEEKNKRILGINEEDIFNLSDTKLKQIFNLLATNEDLKSEILLDETNYSYSVLEAANEFNDIYDEVFCTFSKDEEKNIHAHIVSTNLSGKFNEILKKSKALVLMSGTLHTDSILQNIFGIKDYKKVEAESLNLGSIDVIRTGKEMDCRFYNFTSKKHSREEYLTALSQALNKAVLPTLVHVNAYKDLPNITEKQNLNLNNLINVEALYDLQKNDKKGMDISLFKSGLKDVLFTTKCSRGIDFPGKMCNSIIFTKYPNPNISEIFWKIIKKNHPDHYSSFYKDKAWREFLQRIFRAVRSRDDHVYILSPDIRVLNAVRALQEKNIKALE